VKTRHLVIATCLLGLGLLLTACGSTSATDRVEAFLSLKGITLHLCDHAVGDGIGTRIACNGKVDLNAVSDSEGHLIIDHVPPGTYYAVFDVPESLLSGSSGPKLCQKGDYYVAQKVSDGGRTICYSGQTLGGTVTVVAGVITKYPASDTAATQAP
jgi:hypothetical protein